MNPRLVIAAVVVGVATAGIVGQTFAKAPGPRSHRAPHKSTAHRSMARAQAAADAYSVLARPAVAQDDVSGWNFHPPAALGALRISGARVVYTDSTKMVAAVPTDSGVPCLMTRFADGSGGLNCGRADGRTASLGYHGAIGLVPDAVRSVTYTMTDGTTQTGKVVNNIWHSPAEAAQVAFSLGGSQQTLELMPASSAPKGVTVSPTGVVTGGSLHSGSGG